MPFAKSRGELSAPSGRGDGWAQIGPGPWGARGATLLPRATPTVARMRVPDVVAVDAPPSRRRRQSRNRPWREGGASTARWGADLLGGAMVATGSGALGARAASVLLPPGDAPAAAQAVIWVSFAAPIVVAWSRSRPRGLLRFRALDLLYGVVFGVILRLCQGALAEREMGPAPWPSTPSFPGSLPDGFLGDVIAGVVVAPVLEELFFRGVVLVCVYTVVRRWSGRVSGAVAATAISSALFVGAHLLAAPVPAPDVWTLTLVGIVTAALVLGTGRIGAALTTHVVFNATGFALVAVGTLWG